jgi:hypothetical protein
MTEDEFRDALWSGLGRVLVEAQANDVERFADVILDACLHCRAVDPQSEGTRTLFVYELVQLTREPAFYFDQVIQSLSECDDDWDGVHRFRIASFLAIDGDDRARWAMYENFRPGPSMAESIAVDFLQMDGMKGFLFAAQKVGELLLAMEDVDAGFLWGKAAEAFGEAEALRGLRSASEASDAVRAYLTAVEAEPADAEPASRPWRTSRWGEKASSEEIRRAAEELLQAQSPEEQTALARVFSRRKFPLDAAPLLRLAESADERLALAASQALTHIVDGRARAFAFRAVAERSPARHRSIELLERNFEEGDHEIALRWFEDEGDRGVRHSFQRSLRHLWERRPAPDTEASMLLRLYERGSCSECRRFVLDRLVELGALPPEIREECVYDANEDIRSLGVVNGRADR